MGIHPTRAAKIARFATIPAAILAGTIVVGSASYAAFSAQTYNNDNAFESGSLTITDDDGGVALFNVTDLVPGSTGSKCITVAAETSKINSDTELTMHATGVEGALAPHLNMTIEAGRGRQNTAGGNCVDFVPADTGYQTSGSLDSLSDTENLDNPLLPHEIVNSDHSYASYRITYEVAETAPMDATATVDFLWHIRTV